jgi:hypothetical protein
MVDLDTMMAVTAPLIIYILIMCALKWATRKDLTVL